MSSYLPRPMPPRLNAETIRKGMTVIAHRIAKSHPRESDALLRLIEATKRRRDPTRPGSAARTVSPEITLDIVERVLAMKGDSPWLTGQEIGMACGINLGRVNDILTGVITRQNCVRRRRRP